MTDQPTSLPPRTPVPTKDEIGAVLAAAYWGELAKVQSFVGRFGRAAIDAADEYGYTPLCKAVEGSRSEVVGYLLDRGADALKPWGSDENQTILDAAKTFASLQRGDADVILAWITAATSERLGAHIAQKMKVSLPRIKPLKLKIRPLVAL